MVGIQNVLPKGCAKEKKKKNEKCGKKRGDVVHLRIESRSLYNILQIDSWQTLVSCSKPRVMGAIESLGCNWWKIMHQIDA